MRAPAGVCFICGESDGGGAGVCGLGPDPGLADSVALLLCAPLGCFLYEVHQRAQTLSELSDMRAGRAKATAEAATVDALVASLATPARVVPAKDCGICLAPLNATDPFALPCGHQFHNVARGTGSR